MFLSRRCKVELLIIFHVNVKRSSFFFDIVACAPPVGYYDPQFNEKVPASLIASGDERFRDLKGKCHVYHSFKV